jgi:hypothetical protein
MSVKISLWMMQIASSRRSARIAEYALASENTLHKRDKEIHIPPTLHAKMSSPDHGVDTRCGCGWMARRRNCGLAFPTNPPVHMRE